MTRLVRLTAFVALLAPLCLASGCLQGVNERCQVQTDCENGLLCVLAAGATPQAGGVCLPPNSTGPDMAVIPDLSGVAGADMAPADMTLLGD